MIYRLIFSEQSRDDLSRLKRSEPQAYKKAVKLLNELMEHPTSGSGKPEMLRGDRTGQWSRRISLKHRLVYEILDDKVIVYVLSSYGHYDER